MNCDGNTRHNPLRSRSGSLPSPRDIHFIAILVAATLLLYSGTLAVPWYFDDYGSIIDQPYLHDPGQLFRLLFSPRGVAKLTFALNHRLGGLNPSGFHLVNISIHAGSAVVLYLILKRVFRESPLFPFLSALLFAVHPVQTQAVTYVVQRMTSLSGFFFLLALYLYIRFRENYNPETGTPCMRVIACWVAALVAGALALYSKENAIVLPAVLCLFDRYFMGGRAEGWKRLLIRTLPFVIISCLFAADFFMVPLSKAVSLNALTSTDVTMVSSQNLTPLTYFVTEFSVIWTYLRILVVPYGITLDFAYPVVDKILTLRNVAAGSGLAGVLLLALKLRRTAPRISFGIAWFFLALAVESSFIPLDPLFVHRLYLPVAGLAIVAMDLLMRLPRRRPALVFFSAVICLFSVLTWQRNALWRDPVAFYEDNLSKAPKSERSRYLLATHYMKLGRDGEAMRLLIEAIRINPLFGSSRVELANIYIDSGREKEALALLEEGIRLTPANYELQNSLGSLYGIMGRSEMAVDHFRQALALNPQDGRAYCNMGVHYAKLGMWKEAEHNYRMALDRSPNDPFIHYNLGLVLLNMGQNAVARLEFDQTLKLDPNDRNLIYSLALVRMRLGDRQAAEELLSRLRGISVEMAEKLASEMRLDK